MAHTVADLSRFLESQGIACRIEGDASLEIRAASTLEEAGEGDISFLANQRYTKMLSDTQASAVVIDLEQPAPEGLTVVRCAHPYTAIALLIVHIHGFRQHPQVGIDPSAVIDETAKLGEGANVQHNVTISRNVTIGKRATIYPGCYIGPDCRIGDDVVLMPNVVIYDGSILGDRVTLHSGTVIGNDGLGYAPVGETWQKIPQAGIVEIGDDVEIGANCTIDRATLGKTCIGSGTKMSNLIAIGHGTKVGKNCMLVAQSGLAGSVNMGNHVTLAGQVGVVGHITIGDNVTIGAKAGVINDIAPGESVLGQPAIPARQKKRELAVLSRLTAMYKQLKTLPARVAALEDKLVGSKGERESKGAGR